MAQASQIEESKTALDKVKDTMIEMEDEIARLRDQVQTLKVQTASYEREQSRNKLLLEADKRNRKHLMAISKNYNNCRKFEGKYHNYKRMVT